jgi:hypothetical protein
LIQGGLKKDEHRTPARLASESVAGRSNIEPSGCGVEWEKIRKQTYDLEERLL